jgi:hypothetical protein
LAFIHFFLIPLLFFAASIYFQDWITKSEFASLYKFFLFGIIAAIATGIITKFLSFFYAYSAFFLTIALKSLFIDGFLYGAVIAVSLYYIFNFLTKHNVSRNLSISSLMTFAFISGFFAFINIKDTLGHQYLDSLFDYIPYLSYFLITAIIAGLGYFKFSDSYSMHYKIFWAVLSGSTFIIVSTLYNFFRFYNSAFQHILIIPAGVAWYYFNKYEFRYFRK